MIRKLNTWAAAPTIALLAIVGSPAYAGDAEDLEAQLLQFLANVDDKDTHDRFWSEDLVYTSSAGLRFGKDTIMEGFDTPPESSEGPSYAAEDVDIRVYDNMAVVAFVLVGTSADGEVTRYLNTGTFTRQQPGWRVVAWQATRIPEEE